MREKKKTTRKDESQPHARLKPEVLQARSTIPEREKYVSQILRDCALISRTRHVPEPAAQPVGRHHRFSYVCQHGSCCRNWHRLGKMHSSFRAWPSRLPLI